MDYKTACMKFIEYAAKLETIKYLAQHKRCGTPKCLAQKLDVSERTVERMIHCLRESGFPIIYNRHRNTYEIEDNSKKI